jgi:hypothetical protein
MQESNGTMSYRPKALEARRGEFARGLREFLRSGFF